MKKSLRLIVLTGVVGLTLWLPGGSVQAAYYPNCENQNGRSCIQNGYIARCWWATAGEPSVCICTNGFWNCIMG